MLHIHTDRICLIFLHCVFSNVSSNGLPEKRHSHIGCICLTFLHCAFSNVASNCLHEKWHSHIDCIYLTLWCCQSFSSRLSHLNNFQGLFPLPLWVVLCPNCSLKLSKICDWLLVNKSNVKFPLTYFHFLHNWVAANVSKFKRQTSPQKRGSGCSTTIQRFPFDHIIQIPETGGGW